MKKIIINISKGFKALLSMLVGAVLLILVASVIDLIISKKLQSGIGFIFVLFLFCLFNGIRMIKVARKYDTKPEETRPGYWSNKQEKERHVFVGYGLLSISLILFIMLITALVKSQVVK